jgi:hypothetical protein
MLERNAGVDDIDTTANAIRCNTQQSRESKADYLCGICKPVQTPATHELSLVKRVDQRFESAHRLSLSCLDKPDTRNREELRSMVEALFTPPLHHLGRCAFRRLPETS